jgi:hypothetical protein
VAVSSNEIDPPEAAKSGELERYYPGEFTASAIVDIDGGTKLQFCPDSSEDIVEYMLPDRGAVFFFKDVMHGGGGYPAKWYPSGHFRFFAKFCTEADRLALLARAQESSEFLVTFDCEHTSVRRDSFEVPVKVDNKYPLIAVVIRGERVEHAGGTSLAQRRNRNQRFLNRQNQGRQLSYSKAVTVRQVKAPKRKNRATDKIGSRFRQASREGSAVLREERLKVVDKNSPKRCPKGQSREPAPLENGRGVNIILHMLESALIGPVSQPTQLPGQQQRITAAQDPTNLPLDRNRVPIETGSPKVRENSDGSTRNLEPGLTRANRTIKGNPKEMENSGGSTEALGQGQTRATKTGFGHESQSIQKDQNYQPKRILQNPQWQSKRSTEAMRQESIGSSSQNPDGFRSRRNGCLEPVKPQGSQQMVRQSRHRGSGTVPPIKFSEAIKGTRLQSPPSILQNSKPGSRVGTHGKSRTRPPRRVKATGVVCARTSKRTLKNAGIPIGDPNAKSARRQKKATKEYSKVKTNLSPIPDHSDNGTGFTLNKRKNLKLARIEEESSGIIVTDELAVSPAYKRGAKQLLKRKDEAKNARFLVPSSSSTTAEARETVTPDNGSSGLQVTITNSNHTVGGTPDNGSSGLQVTITNSNHTVGGSSRHKRKTKSVGGVATEGQAGNSAVPILKKINKTNPEAESKYENSKDNEQFTNEPLTVAEMWKNPTSPSKTRKRSTMKQRMESVSLARLRIWLSRVLQEREEYNRVLSEIGNQRELIKAQGDYVNGVGFQNVTEGERRTLAAAYKQRKPRTVRRANQRFAREETKLRGEIEKREGRS